MKFFHHRLVYRTNTAQLIIGQTALSCQLYSLGLLSDIKKITATNSGMLFPQVFEEMGNVIAKQYAGSTLVHNLDSYNENLNKKNRDLLTTVNRYYSNKFSDGEKQQVISSFLGVLNGDDDEVVNEIYLHFPYDEVRRVFYESQRKNLVWKEKIIKQKDSMEIGRISSREFKIVEEKSNVKTKVWIENESDFLPGKLQYLPKNDVNLEKELEVYKKPKIADNACFVLPELYDEPEEEAFEQFLS